MELKQQLKLKDENKKLKSRVTLLEKVIGETESFKEKIQAEISKKLMPLPAPKINKITQSTNPNKRELCLMLNDLHLGLNVYKDEINDINEFNWKIACRRVAYVVKQACNYKSHNKNKYSKIHLILNGDLCCGSIHGLNTKHHDLLVHQINGMLHTFSYVILNLRKAYPNAEVVVHATSGNHSDSIHKREGGNRVTTEKYDNAENYVFYSLSWVFSKDKMVSFDIPKTPYCLIDLPAGRAMVTHGDVMFSSVLGNIGRSLNVKGLSEEIHKFSLGEIKKGKKPIDLLLAGHVHFYGNFQTFHGTEVYIAPSLSGTDAYAHSLNINNNGTGQVVFETTDKFIMGDRRLVRVTDADNKSELDKIIPTFKQTLKK